MKSLFMVNFFELSSLLSGPFANLIFQALPEVLSLYFWFCAVLAVGKHHRRRSSKETAADLVGYTVWMTNQDQQIIIFHSKQREMADFSANLCW